MPQTRGHRLGYNRGLEDEQSALELPFTKETRTVHLPAPQLRRMRALYACVAIPVLVFGTLVGCSAAPAPDPVESFAPGSDAPVESPAVTPQVAEPDTLLMMHATMTAAGSSPVKLELQVHQSTAWDSIAMQTLPAALIADCGGTLTNEGFKSDTWSFTRVNVSVIGENEAEWPAGATVTVEPSAKFARTAGRGALVTDPAAAKACEGEKSLSLFGNGGLALGLPSDPTFTKWAGHAYGFTVAGAMITDCTMDATDLGRQVGTESLALTSTGDSCVAGPGTQQTDF